MHPSSVAASPIAVQESPPGASFPGQERIPRARGKANLGEVGPCSRYLAMAGTAELMEEPPGGSNHGWRSTTAPEDARRTVRPGQVPLDAGAAQHWQFLRDGGWSIVYEKDGARSGVQSHAVNQYTVLHPEDYVDREALAGLVEDELGFTLEDLHSVYSTGGRIPSERLDLRTRIDARLLALSEGGANMDLFGRVTGLNGSTVDRALARARGAA